MEHDGIIITIDKITQANDVEIRRKRTAKFALALVDTTKMSTIKILPTSMHEIAAGWGRHFPNTELWPAVLKTR